MRYKQLIILLLINLMLQLDVTSTEVRNDDNKIIVSGFIIDNGSKEGVQANIIVKSVLDFEIIQKITSVDVSGSYTCKLNRGRYYLIVEKKGYEYYNEQIDLLKTNSARVQKDLYLVPLKGVNINKPEKQAEAQVETQIQSNTPINTQEKNIDIKKTEEIPKSKEQGLNLKIKNGFQHLDIPMVFETSSTKLNSNTKDNLKYIVDFLQKNSDVKLEIRGFSDNGFNNDLEVKVAERRALVVQAYLVSNGISESRLKSIGFPTRKVEKDIQSKRLKRLSHLIEFRIVGNKLEEELLMEKLKEDFLKGEYILSEKMQAQLKSEKPLRFNKVVLEGEDLNEPIKIDANSQKSDLENKIVNNKDVKELKAENNNNITQDKTTNIEDPQFVATNNERNVDTTTGNENQSETSQSINKGDLSVQNKVNGQNSSGNLEPQIKINQLSSDQTTEQLNNQIIDKDRSSDNSELNDEKVLSAYDKFMKEIDDINKKIIFFDKKSSDIKEEYIQVVDSVYDFLRAHPKIDIKITGYASQKEGKSKFMQLSIDRSNNVANYLLKKGIKKTIMKIKSGGNFNKRGKDMPVEDEMRVIFYVEQLKQPQRSNNKVTGAPPKLRVKKDGEQFGTNISASSGENKYDELRNESDHIEQPNLKSEGDYYNHLLEEKSDVTKKGLVFKVQVGAYNEPQTKKSKLFKKVKNAEMYQSNDGYVRYFSGQFRTIELAQIHCTKLIKKGIKDAFVIAIYNGDRILMRDLVKIL